MRVYIVRTGAKILKAVGQKQAAKQWVDYYRKILGNDVTWEVHVIERKSQEVKNGTSQDSE